MYTLITYLKLSLLVTISLLLGCSQQSDEAAASTVKKIIVALEPDKDPDAMLEDRAALESYLSETTCKPCLLYTSPSPRDGLLSRMPSSA